MTDKPRRLIGCIFLAAIPPAVLNVAGHLAQRPGISEPVTLCLEGVAPAGVKEIGVFRIGRRDNAGAVEPCGNAALWAIDQGWMTRLEIEAPAEVWNRVTRATLAIGARFWDFNRSELLSRWETAPVPARGQGEGRPDGVLRLRSPPDVRAETSRLVPFQPYMNWQGDAVLALRLLRPLGSIGVLAVLALLFLFLPRRLPRLVRLCRLALRSALRQPTAGDKPAIVHAVYWNVGGSLIVAGAFAFLEWQSPYYFVQDDALVTEFPAILVGCRGVWEGRLPEWNPYTGLGAPLMSEGMYSLTYPPLYVSYAIARNGLGDEYSTLEVFALMHLMVGFWLCKRVGLRVGCGQAASTFAGLAYVLSGSILILGRCWHAFIPLAVWIPAIALCIEALRIGRVGWRWVWLSAICLAMPVHVGFPQLAVACFGLFCIVALSLLVTCGIQWAAGLHAVAAVMMGLALSVPLLLCQKEHGQHAHKSATTDFSVSAGVAALFLPAPVAAADPQGWSARPEMTHLYFFGGLLAWCWAAGLLLTLGGSFGAWTKGARLWWSTGVAFLLLALGDSAGLWTAISSLPVLSTLARYPVRVLPFFVFCSVVSGGWIFGRLWGNWRGHWARAALTIVALGLLAYHLTRVDMAMSYYLFRPYPDIAGTPLQRLKAPNISTARRVCPIEKRFSPRAAHGMSLADSMAAVHSIYSTDVYDPMAEGSPAYHRLVKNMSAEKLPALQAYGVGWLLVDRREIQTSGAREPAGRSASGEHAPAEPAVRLAWLTIPISEVDETLGRFLGQPARNVTPCGSFELYDIQDASPLVFRADKPEAALPFQAHTEGVDVGISELAGGKLVVNFLRLDGMTAAVDSVPIRCGSDEWGRIVVSIPAGASQLAIRYSPPWKLAGLVGLPFGIAAVGTFLVAQKRCRNRVGKRQSGCRTPFD
jgi:hypothetical protein